MASSPAVNPFEAGARKAIPAVLIYVTCGEDVLMLKRGGAPGADFHAGKWNGLGGKLELDESPLEAAVRETREESGLEIPPDAFEWRGLVQFPNFKPLKQEDWWVSVFVVNLPSQPDRLRSSGEGELHWVHRDQILSLSLWPGDREFLPKVLSGEKVFGTLWYQNGLVVRSWWAQGFNEAHR